MNLSPIEGAGYRLEFDFQPPLLTVWLRGVVAPDANFVMTTTYWRQIAQVVRETGAQQLLVLDELPGEVMSNEELQRFFDSLAGLGLEAVQIAYVEARLDQVERIEYAQLLAQERGYRVQTFANEPEARLWLRYGGS
jgi:ABC-type sugar transport system ATPase subunit